AGQEEGTRQEGAREGEGAREEGGSQEVRSFVGSPTSTRRRLDTELARRGLAPSRERAVELIADGRVTVAGAIADKAARLVAPADAIVVQGRARTYVSRGGDKLAAGLDGFGIAVEGVRALD